MKPRTPAAPITARVAREVRVVRDLGSEAGPRGPGLKASSTGVEVVSAILLLTVFWAPSWGSEPLRVMAGLPLAACVSLCMIIRWRYPRWATFLAYASTAVGMLLGVAADPFLGAAWCLYAVAVKRTQGRDSTVGLIGIAGAIFLAVAVGIPNDAARAGQSILIGVGASAGAWLLGRSEGERVAAMRTRVRLEAEGERLQHQLTLSRDLHDGVGHALSVIGAEADLALTLPEAGEAELRRALQDVEMASREALVQMQAVVRSLRNQGPAADGPSATEAIPRLLAGARSAGLLVTSHVSLPSAIPAQTDTIVVRVVQEALTNVIRHASARCCDVTVRSEEDGLKVRVIDDGIGADITSVGGSGLLGLRERVQAVGGGLIITSLAGGGTSLEVTIPSGVGG